MLNVFTGDAYEIITLTDGINTYPYAPSRIEQMGLFTEVGVATNSIAIELRSGRLSLVPTRDRREGTNLNIADRAKMRTFRIPHIPLDDMILPDDIQGVRSFGTNDVLAGQADVIVQRLMSMRNKLAVTKEYHRIGAIKGTVLDADGTTVIHDLFDEFDISQEIVGFDLNNSSADMIEGSLRVKRTIEDALGAATYDHIHAFCGSDFFDDFTQHASVRAAYSLWRDGEFARSDNRRGFEYAGIVWEEYRGSVGDEPFIDAGVAQFFPVGVPDLFKLYHGPGNFMEAANTIGLPYYARQNPLPNGRGIGLFTETNPLAICTQPAVLIQGIAGPHS